MWVQRHADEVGLKQSEYYEAVGNCRAVLRELEESSRTYSCLVEEREAYEERKQQVCCSSMLRSCCVLLQPTIVWSCSETRLCWLSTLLTAGAIGAGLSILL